MNLSNVSALSISIPLEFVEEKVREIQNLHFHIYSMEPIAGERVRIAAKLIDKDDPSQTFEEIDIDELNQKIRVLKNSKKDPYVW